jgi:hypothetical protein
MNVTETNASRKKIKSKKVRRYTWGGEARQSGPDRWLGRLP